MLQNDNNEYQFPSDTLEIDLETEKVSNQNLELKPNFEPEQLQIASLEENLTSIYRQTNVDSINFSPIRVEKKIESAYEIIRRNTQTVAKARSEYIRTSSAPDNNGRKLGKMMRKLISNNSNDCSETPLTEQDLKKRESDITDRIYPDQPGLEQKFFMDKQDWFFHQEKTDSKGNVYRNTFHYEIHPEGILRIGKGYINGEELDNFAQATSEYTKLVMSDELYKNITKHDISSDEIAA